MFSWRSKINRKKSRGNQTAGKTKGVHCQATPTQRFFAKRSRGCKNSGYLSWCIDKDKKIYGKDSTMVVSRWKGIAG